MMKVKKYLVLLWALTLIVLISGCVSEEQLSVTPAVQPPEPVSEPQIIAPAAPVEAGDVQPVYDAGLVNAENEEVTISFIFGDRTGVFNGTLQDGVPTGFGSFTTTGMDGVKWSYTGFFEDGHFNGSGETTWETGARREGTYKNSSLVEGRIYADDGTLIFDGVLGEQEEHTDEFIQFLFNIESSNDFAASSPITEDLVVHFLDVGQADSIFIQLPNGENMLIDGGEANNASSILRYLRSHDVTTINYLVASHPHADHIGGLPAIIDAMDILNIFMPRVSHTTQTFERLLTSIQNKGLQIDQAIAGVSILSMPDLEIDIIAPVREDYKDHNDHSAVIKLTFGSTSFLFMGDAEGTSEGHIRSDVSVDVLKVGHHGSKTSTTDAFLRSATPSYAVISVGRDNSYGHPTDEVLARLDNADVEVYRTDMVGTIIFTSDGENIIIDKSPSPYQPQAPPAESVGGGGADGNTGSGSTSDSGSGTAEDTSESNDRTVYITRTGARYHKDGCRHLSRSKIETTLSAAKAQGLTACGTCKPPS